MKYIYPKLFAHYDLGFVRIGGNGLANCLFVYARAIQEAKLHQCRIISPTWERFSPSTYLRRERDKRHYVSLFDTSDEITGIKKIFLMHSKETKVISGLQNYFKDLIKDAEYISRYIISHIQPEIVKEVNKFNFQDCVAVHIRLGDYPASLRTPIEWYKKKIQEMSEKNKNYKFLIFSDGTEEELKEVLSIPNVKSVFFGNAIADIYAISRCCYLIGSDSTFSGWGAFLGQVPCTFYKKHYGPILANAENEHTEN